MASLLFAFLYRKISTADKDLPDEVLLRQYRNKKDVRVLGLLFGRYIHLVYGVCLKYLKNEMMAEDASMEIFESLFTLLLRHEVDHFPPWLHRVAANHCLMKLRRKETRMRKKEVSVDEYPPVFMENPDDMHLFDEEVPVAQDVEKAMEGLKKDQQDCLRLFYFEEKSYKEVAEITGMSIHKVKSHIQNGKRNLKLKLERNDEKA